MCDYKHGEVFSNVCRVKNLLISWFPVTWTISIPFILPKLMIAERGNNE